VHARAAAVGLAALGLVAAGCGGQSRQDEDEPEGRYPVEVTADFPSNQKLAKDSNLVIRVENTGSKTIPNANVTVEGFDYRVTDPEDPRRDDPTLADPNRPVFVINGKIKEIGGVQDAQLQAPNGSQTAYVNTYSLGKLRAGRAKTFRWNVTAVKAGDYRIRYRVNAGLDGKARAVGDVTGSFSGTISEAAPDARIAEDGETVITE
jgi:hypothetical protein